jgi:hypothetical protein
MGYTHAKVFVVATRKARNEEVFTKGQLNQAISFFSAMAASHRKAATSAPISQIATQYDPLFLGISLSTNLCGFAPTCSQPDLQRKL